MIERCVRPSRHLARLTCRIAIPLLLFSAVIIQSPPSDAQDLSSAVRIGEQAIPPSSVRSALDECRENAPDLSFTDCVDRYFVPRWLLDAEAQSKKLPQGASYTHARSDLLHASLVEALAREVPAPTPQQIDAFLKKHARDFEKPLRLRIFRIMVSEREKALELLKILGQTASLAEFRTLAREHSLDRATSERAGDLGFVWPDGSTDVPQVRAEKSLYDAVVKAADGTLLPEPVPEGTHFAVVWRRGSLPAVPMSEESRKIAQLRLIEGSVESRVKELLSKLRARVKGRDDSLLSKLRRPEATIFAEP